MFLQTWQRCQVGITLLKLKTPSCPEGGVLTLQALLSMPHKKIIWHLWYLRLLCRRWLMHFFLQVFPLLPASWSRKQIRHTSCSKALSACHLAEILRALHSKPPLPLQARWRSLEQKIYPVYFPVHTHPSITWVAFAKEVYSVHFLIQAIIYHIAGISGNRKGSENKVPPPLWVFAGPLFLVGKAISIVHKKCKKNLG